MSYWNAKYTNDSGEYEITFCSNRKEKAKAVEKFCQAIIDKKINEENAAQILEQLIKAEPVKHARWEKSPHLYGFVRCSVCHGCTVWDEWADGKKWNYCPNCGAKMCGGADHEN